MIHLCLRNGFNRENRVTSARAVKSLTHIQILVVTFYTNVPVKPSLIISHYCHNLQITQKMFFP